MNKTVIAAVVAGSLAVPATAGAHVTLQPGSVTAGSFTKVDVRVPNERDNTGTIKVDLRLPDGFYFLSYQRGERVAWTGAPDAETPAPRLTLLAPE